MNNEETDYQNALDYLYGFIDYSLTRSFRYSPEKFDLTRMAALLESLGFPEHKYPKLHIAGTKGKGSISALCASALQAAGYRTGLYTSPHLEDYAERIQVDGKNIPHSELADLVEEIKPHVEKINRLTTFEITTALAYLYFSKKDVDVAVVEVGLGGRLDATNTITPLVSVISSLSLDHVNVLGDTLEKIAFEKAGIIKPGIPVVSAPQNEAARQVIEAKARENNARLIQIGEDVRYELLSHSLDGQEFAIWWEQDEVVRGESPGEEVGSSKETQQLRIPLLGAHQVENAAAAFATLHIARQAGLKLTDEDIARGFERVNWPARFELIQRDPPVIIDSAHNPDSASKLRQTLDDYLPGLPVVLVIGASEDKDVKGILAELLPRSTLVIATQSIHPRAMEPQEIVEIAHQSGVAAQVVVPFEKAFARALEEARGQAAVLFTGSIFIAAAARQIWLDELERKYKYEG